MSSRYTCFLTCAVAALVIFLFSNAPSMGQDPKGLRDVMVRVMVSEPERALTPLAPSPGLTRTSGTQTMTAGPGLVWTHKDNGKKWIAEAVSIGNHGTQVFSQYYLNNTAAALLSRHDQEPPVAVWEVLNDPDNPGGVDSAEETDIHVSITETETGVNQRIIKVSKYSSGAGPDWVYTYPHLTAGKLYIQISNDGQIIVAAVGNPVTGENDILVFHPSSAVPTATFSLQSGTMWGFDLSADGSRMVIGIHTTAYVLEVPSGNVLFTLNHAHSLSSCGVAISGDGSVFASGGGQGRIRIWEWNGSTYINTFTDITPGGGIVRTIAISDDSTTVAYGIGYAYPSLEVDTKAIDVPGKIVTMHEKVTSYGQYQNTAYDVAICAEGSRFAVAQFGDEPDLVEEVRIFEKYSSVPIATLNLKGSAFNVDISSDGKWVVAGSKAVHANQSGSGGQIDLYHLEDSDFALYNTPSVGSTVLFELRGTPYANGFLIASPKLNPLPAPIPGIGTLYPDWAGLLVIPMGQIGSGGMVNMSTMLPNDPSLIGASIYSQGGVDDPAKLTACWVKLTLVP